jgi:hypothetical protein
MTTTLAISGYLKNINKYNQLIISLDDTTKIKSLTAKFEGNSPLYEYEYNEKPKNTLKVALPPRDKNVAKRFNAIADLTGSYVTAIIEISKYDFLNKEKERVQGWKVTLVMLKKVEKQQKPAVVEDDYVPPPELPRRQ